MANLYAENATFIGPDGDTKDAGRSMVIWKRSVEGALQFSVDVPVSHAAAK